MLPGGIRRRGDTSYPWGHESNGHGESNSEGLDYVIPTAMDLPHITPILVEPVEPNRPYGAKGIGEPAINQSMSAITNAIYNAMGIAIKALAGSPEMQTIFTT